MLNKINAVMVILLGFLFICGACIGSFVLSYKLTNNLLIVIGVYYLIVFIVFYIIRTILKMKRLKIYKLSAIFIGCLFVVTDVAQVTYMFLSYRTMNEIIFVLKIATIVCEVFCVYYLFKIYRDLEEFEEKIKIGVDI